MENTVETPLPIDDESNRLGTLIVHVGGQKIYEYTRYNGMLVFFGWHYDDRRGFMFDSLVDAANFLGLRKPTGCADYNGEVRLGKCIEKFTNGEIWKHTTVFSNQNSLDFTDYYVWWNNGICDSATSLAHARELAEINTGRKKGSDVKTPPKLDNPQNRKGYRPNGTTGKKAA